uniref:Ig-like domain-containing protein n=1 Tax=Macrostomum lignano TaxID=282301 RepID=A0A1I8GPA9_9PLAT
MAQLLALCALCAALCALGGAASSIKFNITTTNIAASWQSSEYFNRCFRDTAVLEQWDYFHTTGTPDSHGNQWLLIKLSRAIRVQSVTVYGRAAEPSRAQNIEILLSDRLPPGLNASNGSCYGTLSGSLSSLTQCGVTQREQTQTHKVACSYSGCPNVTEYILLRKNVRNESDKYMNFQALEVEEEEKPRSVSIEPSNGVQIGSRIFLAPGTEFHFSFITEAAYPSPIHACRLRSLTDASANKSHVITKISEYRLNISAHNAAEKKIQCVSAVGESSGKSVKSISLPELVVPSKPEFLLPPITDLERRPLRLSCCRLNNRQPCSNQPPLLAGDSRRQQKSQRYSNKAEGLAIRISSGDLVSDEEASFSVTASDSGYPAALHQCRIESKSLGEDKTAESDGSTHWRFTPQRGHNGERIRCDVVQKLSGSLIFSQTVNSSNLDVKYKATVTWPRNIAPKKEGETLSFVVLADGNPEPSSQCWLQLVSGAQVDLHKLKHSMFESTFNVTVDRSMNRANLSCVLTQPGLPSSTEQSFTQLITVFYQPQPPLTIDLAQTVYEGTDVTFTVRSGAGNPSVTHRCHVYNGKVVSAIFAHQIT